MKTKEQVMEEFRKLLNRKTYLPVMDEKGNYPGIVNDVSISDIEFFLSSTYDTAYEKGVRDAMKKIEELKFEVNDQAEIEEYEVVDLEDARLALSELLKK